MDNRVLMAKYNNDWLILRGDEGVCGCGCAFNEGETVLLYPNPEYSDINVRDMICLTCHFWFVHEVMENLI